MHALTSSELTIFLFAVGLMLALARFLARIGRRFNVPTLVTELVAGIVLGPTLLGFFFPETHIFFFPDVGNLPDAYDTLFSLSVVMLLFTAGLELDFNLLTKQTKAIFLTSSCAIFIPFIAGFFFALHFFDFLHGTEISASPHIFPLTFATIASISALAVITRTLMEHNIINSALGVTVLGTALLTDLFGWFAYSSVIVYANAAMENIQILYTLLYIIGFFGLVFFISGKQRVMRKIFTKEVSQTGEPAYDLALLFGICLLTAAFTNGIHIHSSLGAFIAGIIGRRIIGGESPVLKQVELFVMNFFAPIFFISIGLKLNFFQSLDLMLVVVIFAFLCCTKIISGYLGARLSGFDSSQAAIIGGTLNSRGAMEIIMGALALNMGLIDSYLFVSFVVASIATIFLAELIITKIPPKIKNLP